jgi:NodT family efflux transporter outer membrane factor (OMF) lipoprotein
LRDGQLDRLMDIAGRDAPSLQIVATRLERARAAHAAVAADLQPNLEADASLSADRFPGHYIYTDPYADHTGSEGALTADVRYHLDFWGQYRRQAQASTAREHAAEFEAADVRLLLQTAVVTTYLQMNAAYRLRALACEGLVRRQSALDLVKLSQGAGLSTDMQAALARDAMSVTRADVALFDGEIARRRHALAALLGKTPAFADTLSIPHISVSADPEPLTAIPAELLGNRPDVAARRASVEVAAKEIGVAKAAFYPNVDLVGLAGFQSLGLGQLLRGSSVAAGLGPALTLPIFEGGRLRANLKRRIAEYDEAVSAYNASIVTALQQVADGIALLKSARRRQQEASIAVHQWTHLVDLQKIRQRSGLSDANDRLTAEMQELLHERHVTEADTEVATAQIDLIRALGGAWTPLSSAPSLSSSGTSYD